MKRQLASVDRRPDGEYVVMTESRAGGPWVLDGPITRLPAGSGAEALGAAVIAAMHRSRDDLPPLTRDSTPAKPLLDEFGFDDYAQYIRGLRSVSVFIVTEGTPGLIKVTPEQNGGTAAGMTPLLEHRVEFMLDDAAQVGTAVLAAFEHTS
ncbi:hypothetical protein [Schumannella sp. 10F1B-5-1]|uniref:hypothetical protein n=1 Tax=Schumannella sp. 10F1B-5-1 TaxID=2590780 RepID=UPI0011301586|nr:hypothetical protein [Schumannella sp. 10F1B-5-1]TPW72321.1 hypothetical protein FJ658_08615 [Schumannella sp. 10F1B-5-1]